MKEKHREATLLALKMEEASHETRHEDSLYRWKMKRTRR